MTEPRKTPRTALVCIAAGYDWENRASILAKHATALEAETQELAEAAQKLLNELDGEAFFQVGPPNAELLYTNAGNLRAALARHRAKQEVQS